MAKVALLIGVSEYEPGFETLPSAINDVNAMQQILINPEMGDFAEADVTVLQNPARQAMDDAIYTLFNNRQPDDLVLLYFSGHGILDNRNEFYLVSRFTRKERDLLVPTTAVAAQSVRYWLEQSRSQRKVIILDSCFSSAFAKGVKAKDSGSVNPERFLGGKGTAILTASTRYAETRENLDLSIYTHYLVDGIRTGGADRDNTGLIAIEELHAYISSKLSVAAPAMTPEFYPVQEGYRIVLAKSPKNDPALQYRKEVKQLAEEDEGDFSFINRQCLDYLQHTLGLSPDEAIAIETAELEPYQQRRAKITRYHTAFAGAIEKRYPLTDLDRLQLQRFQKLLSLRDEDIAAIEQPLLAQKDADYQRQQAQQQILEQQREAERQLQAAAQRQHQERQRQEAEQRRVAEERKRQEAQQQQPKNFAENLGNGITLDMVAIPGGIFWMGQTEAEQQELLRQMGAEGYQKYFARELPQHQVTVPAFSLGKHPVTQAQWQAVAALKKVQRDLDPDPARFKGANRPVEQVSWLDAVEFCLRLSQKTGKPYRLPTEAEWEYACRAGTTTPFHFGETITTDQVNYNGDYTYGNGKKGEYRQRTTEVGNFPANAWGLHDMHGNVWEWCADDWHDSYAEKPETLKQNGSLIWSSSDESTKIVRGGSWIYDPGNCRSASRYADSSDFTFDNIGFRVVCVLPRTP